MAIAANTIFEVQTGGSDTNGGGFVPGSGGTDYSQQTSPQASVTDGVTAGSTTITSATAAFTAAMVGNIIYVQGGTGAVVAGWYQIISRTNATTIVVDRSTGLTAGTGVTLHVGGCLATPGLACGVMQSSNTVYIKSGTYVLTTATANVAGGTLSPPTFASNENSGADTHTKVVGYSTNRNINNTDTQPIIQVPASGVTSCTIVNPVNDKILFQNIGVDGQSKTSIRGFGTTTNFISYRYIHCSAINCTNNAFFFGNSGGLSFAIDCWATGSSSQASFEINSNGNSHHYFVGCLVQGGSTTGFLVDIQQSLCTLADCIADSVTGASSDGFSGDTGTLWLNCTAVSSGRAGFRFGVNFEGGLVVRNCIAYNNAEWGFTGNGSTLSASQMLMNCAGGANTSGNVNTPALGSSGFITLTADPFTSKSTHDLSLNNTAGGGAALRAAGLPTAYPLGTTLNYADVGAAQHQDSGGGGTNKVGFFIQ